MKRAILSVACAVFLAFLAWLVWFVGMAFECEYPYALTLARVQSATSVNGVLVSKIIRADGANWDRRLHWHTCSYCDYWCGDHKNLIHVHLEAPDKCTIYEFAYCCTTRTLVPMTDETAEHFPSLMPAGDQLKAVSQLSRTGGGTLGTGELKLPAKWFQTVIRAEPPNAANSAMTSEFHAEAQWRGVAGPDR